MQDGSHKLPWLNMQTAAMLRQSLHSRPGSMCGPSAALQLMTISGDHKLYCKQKLKSHAGNMQDAATTCPRARTPAMVYGVDQVMLCNQLHHDHCTAHQRVMRAHHDQLHHDRLLMTSCRHQRLCCRRGCSPNGDSLLSSIFHLL